MHPAWTPSPTYAPCPTQKSCSPWRLSLEGQGRCLCSAAPGTAWQWAGSPFFNRDLAGDADYRCKAWASLASKMRFLAPRLGHAGMIAWLLRRSATNPRTRLLARLVPRQFPGPGVSLMLTSQ